MALWDSADLLARLKRDTVRPTVDEDMADADWYALLTEAQVHWTREIATQAPEELFTLEKLTTGDAGLTYSFAAEPLGDYVLRATPSGRLLVPGPEWDQGCDFVPNGITIRFPGQKRKTFADGPWAYYVKMPGALSATDEPTFKPSAARLLLVYRAAILWALRGGFRDPAPYQKMEDDAWFGRPEVGQFGWQAQLRGRPFLHGTDAIPSDWGWTTLLEG